MRNTMHFSRRLVLASASPRRRDLLASAGVPLEVVPSRASEPGPGPGEDPAVYARRLAGLKALEVSGRHPGRLVLGADTVVALAGEVLGKPRDAAHALEMLKRLRGLTHHVYTGVCMVREDAGMRDFVAATSVTFWEAPMAMVESYAASEEVTDKAGAYAIQGRGAFLVKEISGSYTNVVGLPLAEVLEVLDD